ncbi:MAG: cytidine deaminase [Tenericutes bacterium HGW-Tenericutes-3]|nr:MAG: cytidine deaminase [Tenericutes bacterium HGW-Tenericutes-3]
MKNLEQALLARNRAYTPYSNFKVGAAILLKDGTYVLGANVENASFGLSNCAERSALFSLYSQGYKKEDIVSITVVANDHGPVSPCGACRQVMHELMPKGAKVILANTQGEIKEMTTDELLPYAFVLDEKPKDES